MRPRTGITRQRGSALFAALFLLIVVGSLGAYAVRLGVNEQHAVSLQLLQLRAEAAAASGLEFASNRALIGNCPPVVVPSLSLAASPELAPFVVNVSCTRIVSGAQRVYELSATAVMGTYGSADFVQRTLLRRVTDIPPGVW